MDLSATTQLAASEPDTTQRDTSGPRVVEDPECPSYGRAELDGSPSPVEYVLVYNPAEAPTAGHGLGWTMIARHEGWRWSAALAARGAGAHAPARIAQAVVVRVLAEQGVAVTGWSTGRPDTKLSRPGAGPAAFHARLLTRGGAALGHRAPPAAGRPREHRPGR